LPQALQGEDTQTLQKLVMLGGSPQGARPKVLVFYDPVTSRISTKPMPSGLGWLVKFQAVVQRSHMMQLAQTGGLDVRWAGQRLDGMLSALDRWADLIGGFDIRRPTAQAMLQAVQTQRSLLS
jgi:hypothetical protein